MSPVHLIHSTFFLWSCLYTIAAFPLDHSASTPSWNEFDWPSGPLHSIRVQPEEVSDSEWRHLLARQLERHGLVNEVIDTVPPYVVNIDYENPDVCPHLGNQLDPSETRSSPVNINFPVDGSVNGSQSRVFHTLMAIDPDVPSRQNSRYSEFLHWLVVNIPDDDIERGHFLADYVGPLPSQGAGLHRFIFLVYRQTEGPIDVSRLPRAGPCDWLQRARFSARKFANLHNLRQPIAVNFFLTQFDVSVPSSISRCYQSPSQLS